MNKKQLLLTSVLLVSSASYSYAQTLQLSNGDSLDVELIQETDKTLTYSHTILGKQTVQKSAIRNFSELNLIGVNKVKEGAEGQAGIELYDAQKKQKLAQAEVNEAKVQLTTAKKESVAATGVSVKVAEQKELAAGKRHTLAEKNLVAANAAVTAALAKLETTKNISVAGEQVTLAKAELKQAEKDEKKAQKNLVTAEKELDNADSAAEDIAEAKVDAAENKVDIAEENIDKAKGNLLVAEDAAKVAKGEKVNDGFMGTGIFKDWDSSINFGLNGASGTTNNVTFRAGFNARYEDETHRWNLKTSYYNDAEGADGAEGNSRDILNDRQANVSLVKDWFFNGSPWFAYASTVYDYDVAKDWDHRVQVSTGPGYQFIKTETWEFSARAGLTGVFEFNKKIFDDSGAETGEIVDDQNLEMMAGLDVLWHITAKQRFRISNYMYPSLTNAGEFRNLANLAWIHDIDWFEGLAVKVGIKDEYNTAEQTPNEFKYNFSILWAF